MKSTFYSILIVMTVSTGLHAQSLSGEYFMSTPDGEVVLNLAVDGSNQVSGRLTDDDGTQYQVQGSMIQSNATGTLTNAQGGMYFTANRQSNELNLTLIPPNAKQEPDYTQAQAFVLTARNGSAGIPTPAPSTSSGGLGGPLGGNGGTTTQNNWAGTYQGDISGTPSTLSLQQTGTQLNGQINASGYIYNLTGTVNGKQSQGKVVDSRTQGVMTYQASLSGGNLTLSLNANGSRLQLQFTKGGSPLSTAKPKTRQQSGGQTQTDPSKLDQRIVGHWLYTDSHTDISAGFSMVTQLRLIIRADGTYLYGDAKMAGGDANTSFDSGGSGMTPGNWKTENGVIHVNEGEGWYPYAKYIVQGNSMLFTFNDGSKKLWER